MPSDVFTTFYQDILIISLFQNGKPANLPGFEFICKEIISVLELSFQFLYKVCVDR